MMTYGKFPLTLATAALIAVGAVVATAQDTSAPAASATTDVQPTKAEYRDGAHKKGGKHHRAGLFGGRGGGEMMQDIFAEIDVDGDGAVTQAEIDTYRAAKVSQADTSGDGALSLDEFDVIYREMTRTRMVDAFQRLDAGLYKGLGDRTIKVVGSRKASENWVIREAMNKVKRAGYSAMGMKHFSSIQVEGMNISCHEHLYNHYVQQVTGNVKNTDMD